VLRQWRLIPDDVRMLSSRSNTHWAIRRGTEAFVLRRYRSGHPGPSIAYEFEVLRHLHARGWPVAAPIDDVVWHEKSAFALFPRLPGRAPGRENDRRRRDRGRILAELHRDLVGLDLGQRVGWRRTDEIVLPDGAPPETDDLVGPIRAHWSDVHKRLTKATEGGLPVAVVHGDLIGSNLLFEHGKLTGVLDLDSTHLDLRAADVACARRSATDEVVLGYLAAGTLSAVELGCLDDLWRASVLRYAAQLLASTAPNIPVVPELEWCLRQLDKTCPFDNLLVSPGSQD
jgi:Ser/Thr protein kinase RdoA (MazF antagonist)